MLRIIVLAVLLLFSGFFSGVETALMSISTVKVKSLLREKRKGSEALQRIKSNPHRLIITILVGNNIVNIGAASYATVVFTDLFGSSGIGIATGVMTFLILVFGEITPKTFAAQNAERISLAVAGAVELLSRIMLPVLIIFEHISKFMTKTLGTKTEKALSEEEIRTIVAIGRKEGILDKGAAEMMQNILRFEKTKVTDIMTPDADIEMINGNLKLKDVLDFVIRKPYSRYPVFLHNRDNIIGILDVDDILRFVRDRKLSGLIKNISRPVYFVPESKEIDDLLAEFEGKKIPLAIVVDEYGHVSGLVTVEDILEEIVGDIFDKSKISNKHIKKINERTYMVNAKVPVEDLNELLSLGIRSQKYNTVAGLIEHKLQRIPRKGEKIREGRATITVDLVTKQEIKRVRIVKS